MEEEPKRPAGLFRLKDLESVEVGKQSAFPTPPSLDSVRPHSDEPVDEMAAAIRQARQIHGDDHIDIEGLEGESLDDLVDLAEQTDEPDPEEEQPSAIPPERRGPAFQSVETKAVIKAAEAEMQRRSRQSILLLVFVPLLLAIAATATLLFVVLDKPVLITNDFNVTITSVTGTSSGLTEMALWSIPELEPDPAIEEEQERQREEEEERERRREEREDREREREEIEDDLF